MSLRLRLVILLLATYSLGGWLLTSWLVGQMRPRYLEAMEETLVETSLLLAGQLEAAGAITGPALDALARTVEGAGREPYPIRIFSLQRERFLLRVLVADASGRIVYDSFGQARGEQRLDWPDIARPLRGEYGARAVEGPERKGHSREVLSYERGAELSWIFVGAPVHLAGAVGGVVSVGKPTSAVETLVSAAKTRILLGATGGGLLLLLALLLAANWVVGPLERLAHWARAVSEGKSVPDPGAPGRTLGNLRNALVSMRENLAGQNAIEQYTRSLAHEIKAPLTGIRGAAEILLENPPEADRQRFTTAIREDAGRIQRLVDELLALSRLRREGNSRRADLVDLPMLVDEACQPLRQAYAHAGMALRCEVPDGARVRGDPQLLCRAVVNLLQNALEFSEPGSAVAIRVESSPDAVELHVEDQGTGIPDYALEQVFERFYSLPRPHSAARSSGLGLNIVREIMDLHGGTVRLANRSGGGVRATLRWPHRIA